MSNLSIQSQTFSPIALPKQAQTPIQVQSANSEMPSLAQDQLQIQHSPARGVMAPALDFGGGMLTGGAGALGAMLGGVMGMIASGNATGTKVGMGLGGLVGAGLSAEIMHNLSDGKALKNKLAVASGGAVVGAVAGYALRETFHHPLVGVATGVALGAGVSLAASYLGQQPIASALVGGVGAGIHQAAHHH